MFARQFQFSAFERLLHHSLRQHFVIFLLVLEVEQRVQLVFFYSTFHVRSLHASKQKNNFMLSIVLFIVFVESSAVAHVK